MYFVQDTVLDGYVADFEGMSYSRVYGQYRTKSKASKWFEITPTMANQLAQAIWSVRNSYDIDNVSGELLNVIGRIVVASRTYIVMPDLFPGWFHLTDGSQFGDTDAMFSSLSVAADADMSDSLYRLVIKSKIAKNNGDATIESILDGVSFLLPNTSNLKLIDEDGAFTIEYSGTMTELERWALTNSDLVPRPQGVKFKGFTEV